MAGWTAASWVFFLLGSTVMIFVSRKSLRSTKSHGFYRFFAWEILLVMVLGNVDGWFHTPFSWNQLISWVLLSISLLFVTTGLRLLSEIGDQNAARKDEALFTLEKTTRLITVGIYRYIRHPLYSSLLFLAWGIFFKSPSWQDAGLALVCTALLIATARVEEKENIAVFGDDYIVYMNNSKMFIPYIF